MSVLESLLSRLSPIKLYSLSEGGNTYNELSAFAVGLEILRDELSEMLSECFLSSAESYGLSRYERLWGGEREHLPTDKRREMLISRSSLNLNDFTPLGVSKIFDLLGVAGTINEFPAQQRLSLDLSGEALTKGEKNFIKSQAEALFPAHLDIDVVFAGLTWKEVDSRGNTFSQLETLCYTWQEIDIM